MPGATTAAAAMLAIGAAAALLASGLRDESRAAMASGHDRRTFRGKLHAHSFGKYRLRKNKDRRLKKIRDGEIDLENVVQHGQPEPEHVWDMDNVLENRMFYVPDFARDAYAAVHEESLEAQRAEWKSLMGVKGPQGAFKNWTPPAGEAQAAPELVAAAVVGELSGAAAVKALRDRSRAGILDCKKALAECDGDQEKAMAWLKKKGVAKADKKSSNIAAEGNIASYVHFNNKIAVLVEVNSETDFVASNEIFKGFTADIAMQIAANPMVVAVSADDVPAEQKEKAKALEMAKEDLDGKPENIKEKIVAGRLSKQFEEMALMGQKWLKDEDKTVGEVLKETIAKLGENIVIRRFARLNLGEGLEKKDADFAAGVEKELAKYRSEGSEPAPKAEAKEEKPKEEKPKEEPKAEKKEAVKVSAAAVKELRQRSGAGIMDSKTALAECDGDTDKAMAWLKKKGMAKADKKAGNLSAEGAIATYVHFNQKIGVICEINSETDFVAMNDIFKEFAADVAMQIAANPAITCVTTGEVPAAVMEAEKAAEMEKEDLKGKPEQIREKIVMGRLKKKFEEMALMNQTWLKDEDKTVEQVLKEKIAKLGENIIIRRFQRLTLGEGLEKKDDDFAAGVEKELAKYRS